MKKNIIFICLLFILFSCKDKKEKINSFTFDHLKCEMKIYAQNDSTKPFMKLDLYFAYPAKAENDTILSRVQKAFVYAFAGEKYAGMSPKGAFEAYKDSLAMDSQSLASDMQDDLDLFGECYINIKTEVTDTTQNIIAVKTEKNTYAGGPHDSFNVYYYNISRQTGQILNEKDIFKNYSEKEITNLIFDGLRKKYGESLKDNLFEEEEIRPNGNFRFATDGLVYAYNEYEIAPYTMGLIETVLPYSQINPLLKNEYKKTE